MPEQIIKYGPCPVCGVYIKPCKCQSPQKRRQQDLKFIREKINAMEYSGVFYTCPDVLEKIRGAVEGALADIEIERLKKDK